MLQYKKDLFYGEKWTEEGRELKGWKKEIMEVEVTVQFSCSVVSNSVTEWTAAHQLLRCQESLKGCSGLVHWDDPEGWDGEGGERGVQDGETHVHPWRIQVNVWQNQYNIVK